MDILPKNIPTDIEKIILDYLAQLEHFEKFKKIIKEIEEGITIEYLIPILDYNTGYIIRSVKYNNKKMKRLSSVLCYCCGRDISITHDEYNNDRWDEEDVDNQLHMIYQGIIDDWYNGDYITLKEYTFKKHQEICDKINNELDDLVINGNGYELYIEGIEDIDIEDIDIEDITEEELLEMIEDIEEFENMDMVD